jgi:hypothetical protein
MIQQHRTENICFVGDFVCDCCQNSLREIVPFLLEIVDTSVTYLPEGTSDETIYPLWMVNKERRLNGQQPLPFLPYHKAKDLPPTENHVVCAFSVRTGRRFGRSHEKTIGLRQIQDVVSKLPKPIYNLGDEPIEGTEFVEYDLVKRFDVLKRAKRVVCSDNGIAHLSLMTNAQVTVVHPKLWNARRYYPDGLEFVGL